MPTYLPTVILIAGITILTVSLIMRIRFRYQRRAKQDAARRAAAQAAREAQRKRQAMLAEPPKIVPATGSRSAPDRIPLGDSHDPTFAAGVTPRHIAKWETEIHQIGRQMIGQIDSKGVVLQTLTLEANRAANRLEILIDHLESLLKNHSALQKPPESPEAEHANLMPREAAVPSVEVFAEVLEELENELDQLHETVEEPVPAVSILKMETPVNETPQIAVQPRIMEFSIVSPPPPEPPSAKPSGLSFETLFDDSLVKPQGAPVLGLSAIPPYQTPLIEQPIQAKPSSEQSVDRFVSDLGTSLDKRRQVEMYADYGYSPKQIAEDLNMTVGEVELMISLRN